MKAKYFLMTLILSAALILSACAPAALSAPLSVANASNNTAATAPIAKSISPVAGSVADMEQTLEQIYAQVNPSVVAIQTNDGLGSGFVWDRNGHIVTNNHVVAGASQISVEFYDGTLVPATLVGRDPDSDLAVVKVNLPTDQLQPVTMADSTQVKVGQLSVAIGNPFGNENTMTVGFISALARSLPVDNGTSLGSSYSIPDIIQTDAAINPGNSGGVLTDDRGYVIGVTAAIDSPVRASSGIGFVIPSAIVSKVVPDLIATGHADHTWLGISGGTLTPNLAQSMNLNSSQRGALINSVMAGSPSAQAGLRDNDVITAIDSQAVKSFNDLVAYLARSTSVGQTVTLTILRGGQSQSVQLTLAARPKTAAQALPRSNGNNNPTVPSVPSVPSVDRPWLGISGLSLSSEINTAMNLSANQPGVLIEQVQPGSPAAIAGLQSSTKSVTINGQDVLVGGDVIIAIDQQPVSSIQELQFAIAQTNVNQQVTLSILRDGQSMEVSVTLAARPTSIP